MKGRELFRTSLKTVPKLKNVTGGLMLQHRSRPGLSYKPVVLVTKAIIYKVKFLSKIWAIHYKPCKIGEKYSTNNMKLLKMTKTIHLRAIKAQKFSGKLLQLEMRVAIKIRCPDENLHCRVPKTR